MLTTSHEDPFDARIRNLGAQHSNTRYKIATMRSEIGVCNIHQNPSDLQLIGIDLSDHLQAWTLIATVIWTVSSVRLSFANPSPYMFYYNTF